MPIYNKEVKRVKRVKRSEIPLATRYLMLEEFWPNGAYEPRLLIEAGEILTGKEIMSRVYKAHRNPANLSANCTVYDIAAKKFYELSSACVGYKYDRSSQKVSVNEAWLKLGKYVNNLTMDLVMHCDVSFLITLMGQMDSGVLSTLIKARVKGDIP